MEQRSTSTSLVGNGFDLETMLASDFQPAGLTRFITNKWKTDIYLLASDGRPEGLSGTSGKQFCDARDLVQQTPMFTI